MSTSAKGKGEKAFMTKAQPKSSAKSNTKEEERNKVRSQSRFFSVTEEKICQRAARRKKAEKTTKAD